MSTPANTRTSTVEVKENPSGDCNISTTTFAVALPPSILRGWDEPQAEAAPTVVDQGMVGNITFLGIKSVMVWFGWGNIRTHGDEQPAGSSTSKLMGPLVISMPRTSYRGAFSASNESASSKLIGTSNEDEELIARQMSARLSQKLNMSVLISCSLVGAPAIAAEGVDQLSIQHRAAAHVEKEVFRLVSQRQGL